jgi:hypothetical protein
MAKNSYTILSFYLLAEADNMAELDCKRLFRLYCSYTLSKLLVLLHVT